jgi:hypothetical protein
VKKAMSLQQQYWFLGSDLDMNVFNGGSSL